MQNLYIGNACIGVVFFRNEVGLEVYLSGREHPCHEQGPALNQQHQK